MVKIAKAIGGRIISRSKAFALGLSGAGLIVTPTITLEALQGGDSIRMAWSRVGDRLTQSADKHFNERRKEARK